MTKIGELFATAVGSVLESGGVFLARKSPEKLQSVDLSRRLMF